MEYEVEVIETLKRQKVIEADSLNQALEKLQEEYKNCNIILNENDFDGVKESGYDASDEYSKGWDEAMEEAYSIVCRHLNMTKEKVKEDNAGKIL